MQIATEPYLSAITHLPDQGQHIVAHWTEDLIVVYQAYNHRIADFAIEHQILGGDQYSYGRMSWIKPNFLWMMYRCGWAQKDNQERVLAIWIKKEDFNGILSQAVFSSYTERQYASHEVWRQKLETQEVRLQWDPDHDPYGAKLSRRAIQLGLKGSALEQFGKKNIMQIEDVTPFVIEQREHVKSGNLSSLQVPVERVYIPEDIEIRRTIAID